MNRRHTARRAAGLGLFTKGLIGKMTNKELFEALRMFEKEKDIPMDYMLMQIEKAITIACKNYFDGNEDVIFKADPEKNSFDVKLKKTVVDRRQAQKDRRRRGFRPQLRGKLRRSPEDQQEKEIRDRRRDRGPARPQEARQNRDLRSAQRYPSGYPRR